LHDLISGLQNLGEYRGLNDFINIIAVIMHLPLDPDTNVRVYDRFKIMKEVALTV
jgi:hypothetical protein